MEKELIKDLEHRRKKCEYAVILFYSFCVSLSFDTLLGQKCKYERINKKTYD